MTPLLAADPGLAMQAIGLTKHYGQVVALEGADFELARGEILAVVGDNGAGKSTLIKVLAGALIADSGQVYLDGAPVRFSSPIEARLAGIETVYQELAVAAQLDIAQNMFLGRELRKPGVLGSVLRQLDKKRMRQQAAEQMHDLGVRVQSIRQPIEPTAALGVRETHQVLDLIRRVRERGLSVVLISHSMSEVFAIADRIHIHRLGRRAAIVSPKTTAMSDVVAVMTGALPSEAVMSATLAPAGAPTDQRV
jgi:fructose transport system ATP-binding protein